MFQILYLDCSASWRRWLGTPRHSQNDSEGCCYSTLRVVFSLSLFSSKKMNFSRKFLSTLPKYLQIIKWIFFLTDQCYSHRHLWQLSHNRGISRILHVFNKLQTLHDKGSLLLTEDYNLLSTHGETESGKIWQLHLRVSEIEKCFQNPDL